MHTRWRWVVCGVWVVGLALAGCRSAPAQQVAAVPESQSVEFVIAGMHCDGCAMAVGDALKDAEGVADASVTFANKRAVVRFDPTKTSVAALTLVIEKAGYKPTVAPANSAAASPPD